MSSARRACPAAVRATVLLVLALAAAGAASAHASLASVSPREESRLDPAKLPAEVAFSFTEPLDPTYTEAHVLDGGQRRVEAGPSRVVAPQRLALPFPDSLPDGVYVVTWRALSTVDGHTTAGAFWYLVGNATIPENFTAQAPARAADSGGPVEQAGRGFAMLGLFLVAGVSASVLFLAGPVPLAPDRFRVGAARLAIAGAAVALAGALVAGLAYAARVADGGAALDALLGTRIGQTWVARVALTALALAATALASRFPIAGWRSALALSGAALLAQALASHGAGLPIPALGVLMDAVHLGAGAVWLGGLPAVALALAGADRRERAAMILSFSALATWSVAITVLTGAAMSFAHLGSVANLWLTPWGRALVVKLALVAVLLAMGVWNKWVLVPRIARGEESGFEGLWRAVSAESAVALALVVSVVLLTGTSPPSSEAAPEPAGGGAPVELFAEGRYGTNVTLRIGPADPLRPGLHLYEVVLRNATSAVSNANVTIEFTYLDEAIGTSELAIHPRGDGVYRRTAGNLALPGLWRVEVVSSGRPDALDERVAFDVEVSA